MELLGLGNEALRLVPVNTYFQIDVAALKAMIKQDREDGHLPFCVDLDKNILNEIDRQIIIELQEQGIAVVSGTIVRDKYVLHAAITNHRSCLEDFNILVREVIRIGNELTQD